MLRLAGGQVESLFDELLPVEVHELPANLAVLDRLLADARLLAPIEQAWERATRGPGRPTIPMGSFVRLMVVKQRTGWGYGTLVREVSDSLHLRRFCLLPLTARVPDESTVRKLVRRLGPETVNELTRVVIGKAQREPRFRVRAVRIDSTVVEADVRYPSDAVLALQGARALARQGRKLAGLLRGPTRRVVDRSRRIGKTVRAISKTLARRTGRRTEEVVALNAKAGRALGGSIREAQALATQARAAARGRGARAKLRAARQLEVLASRCQRIVTQIQQRQRGEKITDRGGVAERPRRATDPQGQAGPAQRVWLRRPGRRSHRQHPPWRPWLRPAGGHRARQPGREPPARPDRRRAGPPRPSPPRGRPGRRLRARPDRPDLARLAPTRTFISGRAEPGSRRTRKRLARYRTGAEGRISHLKRGYGLRRSRLKGDQGQRTWTGWAILAYNLDTLAIHTA